MNTLTHKFEIGDIVDWKVLGGGGPGYEMGVLRCKVIYTGLDIGLVPLSWEEAHDFFVPRECTEEDWPGWVGDEFCEPMEERLTLVERTRPDRYIEFVFRTKTTAFDLELDDLLSAVSEDAFPNYYDESPEHQPKVWYIPEGSHWKEVDVHDPYVQNYLRRVK